jgi:tetratricopeptide (TPR) repeat protein
MFWTDQQSCMPRLESRWLPVLAVAATLALEAPFAFSETRSQTVPMQAMQSASQVSVQSLALPTQQKPDIAPAQMAPPTPEQQGDALMIQQHYQAAIEAYKRTSKRSAELWNKLGIAYQMMFNLEEAQHCYQASLHMNKKDSKVMNNLGTIFDSQRQYGNAEKQYRKALRQDPWSALIHKNLGTNLMAQHKYEAGWEMYEAALQIDPNVFINNEGPRVQNPTSLQDRGAMNYYMARGCMRIGLNDCAIDYLRIALNEGYTNPKKLAADADFAGLKGLPAFEQLIAAQREQ